MTDSEPSPLDPHQITADQVYDFIIIGAGIAGASVAANLAKAGASILILEAESQAGYHSTGRSAAMYVPSYGPPLVRALTRASSAFFQNPPADITEYELLNQRDILIIGTKAQQKQRQDFLAEMQDVPDLAECAIDHIATLQPLLRPDYASFGIIDRSGSEIDVSSLHNGFLRAMKAHGGSIQTNAEILALNHHNGIWHIKSKAGDFRTKTIINAAGAWADEIAKYAGIRPIGLVPKRRTALLIEPPHHCELTTMPMTIDIDEDFYLKPEASQLLISPANEDPTMPCDAQADEMDIAICIDRIERAFDLTITRLAAKWAGLRSFVSDKEPVVGFADNDPNTGFFWLAGQGGYGIQTSPALGMMAANLAMQTALPNSLIAQHISPDSLSPERFGQR